MTQPAAQPVETETMTMREAVASALREEMRRDDRVILLGEDIATFGGIFGVTAGFLEEFGDERVRDTPISEMAFMGAGVGAASTGLRPVVELMFSDFLGVCAEQVINQSSKMRYMFGGEAEMPLTVRTTEGAGMSAAGQHSGTIHTWLAHYPGVVAAVPGTPAAAKGLLKTAIRSDDTTFVFENKLMYDEEGPVPTDDEFSIPFGSASVEREGDDVTVIATQRYVGESLALADELDEVDLEVIDPRTLSPLDTDTIVASVEKTGRAVVVDESPLSYGVHAEIGMRVAETAFPYLESPIQRVGVPDVHIPFNPSLEQAVLPGRGDIEAAIRRTL